MWWLLIVTARPASEGDAFDDVGVKCALREEFRAADLFRLGLEHVDEGLADEFALGLRIGDAREAAEEQRRDVLVDQRDVEVAAEQRDHLLALAQPHQPVIDIDAGQLVADGFVDQYGGDCTIDPAGQAADHFAPIWAHAHLRADFGNLGLAEFGHGPVAGQAADVADEILEQLGPVGGVHHFHVELGGVDALLVVGDNGKRRALAGSHRAEAGGEAGDTVAVAHPHLVLLALGPEAIEQRAAVRNLDEGATEFAQFAAQNLAAELVHQRLLAIANAQDRQAAAEDLVRNARAALVEHRSWAAREDNPLGPHTREGRSRAAERCDLGIGPGFAHAAGDQLGNLAAEIDDEDGVGRLDAHTKPIGRATLAVQPVPRRSIFRRLSILCE